MEELEILLSKFVKKANADLSAGRVAAAKESILHAAECALRLAKSSAGAKREKHLNHYKKLLSLVDDIEKREQPVAQAPKAPVRTPVVPPKSTPKAPVSAPPRPATPDAPPPRPTTKTPVVPPPRPSYPEAEGGAEREEKSAPTAPERAPKKQNTQAKYGANDYLSPRKLDDYIGQPDAVTAVRDLIDAARIKMSSVPHLILYGSNGLGKTTFSKIIANELGVGFHEINASKVTPAEMVAFLKKLAPRDVLFIDEIHLVPVIVAESVLYSAMQDGRITYTEGKGKFARTVTVNLPPFTLIGGTTEIGKMAKPFTHRAITIRLREYTDEVLATLVKRSANNLGYDITPDLALVIARRCRNNPRTANNMVKRISDKALTCHVRKYDLFDKGPFDTPASIRKIGVKITADVIEEFFTENGIDAYGLESGDRELLEIIIHRYKGGPVGLDNLARTMNESNNVISQRYEAYLIKKGLIRVDRDGRVAMPEAYRALGLTVPESAEEAAKNAPEYTEPHKEPVREATPPREENTEKVNKSVPEEKKSRYDKIKIDALPYVDELKCEKIEALITYPENVAIGDESLDELFPDVEKPEVEIKTTYELDVKFKDFTRVLICDSKLESKFAMALVATGYVKDIKAQTLEIPYISQELANRRYFPDFVIRDHKGRIAVIEMKNYEMVSYHLNIDKYEHLRRYCEANGFGYSEIMKPYDSDNYVSMDMIKRAEIDEKLHAHINDVIVGKEERGEEPMFTEDDFVAYIQENGATDRSKVYTILLNDRRLKNVDRVGKSFKIKRN